MAILTRIRKTRWTTTSTFIAPPTDDPALTPAVEATSQLDGAVATSQIDGAFAISQLAS